MKIQISLAQTSLSATTFAKGDRVVVRAAKDEWYVGTVTRAGVKLSVTFDDGASTTVDDADFKHVKMLTTKNPAKMVKRAQTDDSAKAMFAKPAPAPKAKAKIPPEFQTRKPAAIGTRETLMQEAITEFVTSRQSFRWTELVSYLEAEGVAPKNWMLVRKELRAMLDVGNLERTDNLRVEEYQVLGAKPKALKKRAAPTQDGYRVLMDKMLKEQKSELSAKAKIKASDTEITEQAKFLTSWSKGRPITPADDGASTFHRCGKLMVQIEPNIVIGMKKAGYLTAGPGRSFTVKYV